MSKEDYTILEQSRSDATTIKTAEYKDGQLQIVEMAPYVKGSEEILSNHVVAEGSESSNEGLKYMQMDSSKNLVVDYLNLTFVRCDDGQESYRLVSNTESESGDDTTVTCVLSNEDGDIEGEEQENSESYVMVEGEEGPLVFLQSSLQQTNTPVKPAAEKKPMDKALTPAEILETAKALQKAKALMAMPPKRGPGRRRKGDLPPPHELLTSPQFKLFLYSCKLCAFRCNAIKELTAHKAAEHGTSGSRWTRGGGGRAGAVTLQCARCPFRGHSHSQLMRHVKERHLEVENATELLSMNSEIDAADVLVCGACGFESSSRVDFKKHIADAHGAVSC